MPLEVLVHAQFPKVVQPNIALDLRSTNWAWKRCLIFPVNKLNSLQLLLRPYKWIRYATGVVVGARGHLSRGRNTLTPIEYNDALPAESISLYYHTTDQAKLSMFPIDPKLADPRIVTSKGSTSSRMGGFRSEVVARDGHCVATGDPDDLCAAAHLLPHRKGDEYIQAFFRNRTQNFSDYNSDDNDDNDSDDIIQEIDDVRNGLFVTSAIHTALGYSDLAFLKVSLFDLMLHRDKKLTVSSNRHRTLQCIRLMSMRMQTRTK